MVFKNDVVCINIWDDYKERNETFSYVDDSDIPFDILGKDIKKIFTIIRNI